MLSVCLVLVLLLILSLIPSVFNKFRKFKRKLLFSFKIPGPSFWEILRNGDKINVLTWSLLCRKKYGKRFISWFGESPTLFLNTPSDIKEMLTNSNLNHKPKVYDMTKPWLGEGLLTRTGEKWSKRRKLLNPTFHFNLLKQYQTSMEECSEVLVNKLSAVADGRPLDIQPYFTLFSLDVISEAAMGVRINAQENQNSEYVNAVRIIRQVIYDRVMSLTLDIPILFYFSSLRKRQEDALKVIHGTTKRIIEMRRKNLKNENVIFESNRRQAFLDMLLTRQSEGNDLTDENIQNEVNTFMFGGHDTVSSALSFTIYELSQNPDIQERLHREILEFQGCELESMKYLESVIKETMRLYPPVPIFSRCSKEDTKIGDLIIPPEVNVHANMYALHRDPDIYPDPELFKPDRFFDTSEVQNYAYIPFSAGPRNCIGQKFAMIELKIALIKMLLHFQFLPIPEYKPDVRMDLVIKSRNGIYLKIKKRY